MLFFQLINIHFQHLKRVHRLFPEVEMIMIAALGIEVCAAMRALIITVLVFTDGHLLPANTAQNGFGFKFIFVPHFSFMSRCFFMTIKTRIISIAAFKLNGNYIKWRMIMRATCLLINCFSFYYDHCVPFNLPLIAPGVFPLFFRHHCRYRDAQPIFVQLCFVLR